MFSGPLLAESAVPALTRLMVSLTPPVSPQAPPATRSTTADRAPQMSRARRRCRADRLLATRAENRPWASECSDSRVGGRRSVLPRTWSCPSLTGAPTPGSRRPFRLSPLLTEARLQRRPAGHVFRSGVCGPASFPAFRLGLVLGLGYSY